MLSVLTLGAWAQTSPYTGNAVANGEEWYLYNAETGMWLGNNNRVWGSWTTRAQANEVGLDWRIEQIEGGWRLDPKYGKNNSMNSSNFYLDTNDAVTAWTFDEVSYSGATKAYKIHVGDKYLGVVEKDEVGNVLDYDGNTQGTWILVTREQRLAIASENNPIDASFLIPCYDMGDNNPRYNWTLTSNGSKDGPKVMWECNRVWETWNVTEMDAHTVCSNIPNGKYLVYAIGAYVPTGGSGMNSTDYHDFLNNGSSTVHALAYANDKTAKMASIYSETYDSKQDDRWPREIETGVWVADGWGHVANQCGHYNKYWSEPVEITVSDGNLRVGVKMDGQAPGTSWVIFSGMRMKYLGLPEDLLTPALEALNANITAAEAYHGQTTDALQAALNAALTAARALTESTDVDKISSASSALFNALEAAEAVDVSVLRATITLAEAEGISIPTSVTNFLANGTTNEIETHLRLVRNLRKLNAIEKVDITRIECSEPTSGDFYLYNVGAGIFFSTTADWGTHIAIDNPGMLVKITETTDGNNQSVDGLKKYHMSGGGWNGLNWEEEYWDKNGDYVFHFTPVANKQKVYYLNVYDNHSHYFVYDPAEDVCDNNTHYWNAVQKRVGNDYKDNPYAQWMLVSPEAYKAAMYTATETNPLDVTFLINNPNFTKAKVDGNDNWDRGWTGIGAQKRGADREPWMVIEWFEANADMKQTITGLTPGKYRVSCYGFYRDGSSDHEATKVKNSEALIQNAFLYANNVEVALPNVTSEAGNMPGIGETRDGVNGEFACWPWQANEYFQTGLYKATTPVVEVGEDGELTIGVKSTYNNVSGSWVVVGNFRLESLGVTPESVTVSSAGYATYCSENALDFSNTDIKAYVGTKNGDKLTFTPATQVPANTGLLLVYEGGKTENVPVIASATPVENNCLVGVNEETTIDSNDYILNVVNGGAGFYKAGSFTTLGAHKAYIPAAVGNGVKGFAIDFDDDATGISLMEDGRSQMEDGAIYNLAGQRLSKTQKGINIVNGKKILK